MRRAAFPLIGILASLPLLITDAEQVSNENYKCASALQMLHVIEAPGGPQFAFEFAPGFEVCKDAVTEIEVVMYDRKRCLVVRFPSGDAMFCPRVHKEV